MSDPQSRLLDGQIIAFIRRYAKTPAPELAFELLALRIFSYQFKNNPHYRNFCKFEKKTPSRVRSWKDIPAMPALAFKELALTSFPKKRHVRVFRTSGTTLRRGPLGLAQGEARGAHYFDTLVLYENSIEPPLRRFLLPDDSKPAYYFLISSANEVPDSSLSYMTQVIDSRLAGGKAKVYVRNGKPLFDRLTSDLRKEKKKVLLFSTALALKGFFDHLVLKGVRLRLPRGSRLLETGGFKGRVNEVPKKKLYKLCGELLGIPATYCVSEYGMTELSSQYYDTTLFNAVNGIRQKSVKRGPSWLRTVVVDPRSGLEAKKGEAGLLRHVDLANRGSIVAVQTEDMGRLALDGFELLGRVAGTGLRGCSLHYEEFIRRHE